MIYLILIGVVVGSAVGVISVWDSVKGEAHTTSLPRVVDLRSSNRDRDGDLAESRCTEGRRGQKSENAEHQRDSAERIERELQQQRQEAEWQRKVLSQFLRLGNPATDVKWTVYFAAKSDTAALAKFLEG